MWIFDIPAVGFTSKLTITMTGRFKVTLVSVTVALT